ncbi:glycoside hydrolase/deacetylase, partial [Basidiobolus meristosporus CBS 931.73]
IITECVKPGLFALTFDDGPGLATGDLLAILKKKKVKATFFSLGIQARDISIGKYLKQALDDGHQVASHTDRHLSLNTLTVEEMKEEMKTAEISIKQATGVVPVYMRPPYGDCNPTCQEVMKTLGYQIVAWNVDSNDWQYVGNPERYDSLVSNIVEKVGPSNPKVDSFISLQHDIHDFSIERTSKIIDIIKEKGYKFTTVAECLG